MDHNSVHRDESALARIQAQFQLNTNEFKFVSRLELPHNSSSNLNFNLSPIAAVGKEEAIGFAQFVDLPTPGLSDDSPLLKQPGN